MTTAAVILAGGLGRRMGAGDKSQQLLAGRTLLDQAIERLTDQASPIVLSSNRDHCEYPGIDLPLVKDALKGHLGPLVGILSAMEWLQENEVQCQWLVSVASDTPWYPLDLVERLETAAENESAEVVVCASNGRTHPVFALWSISLASALRSSLERGMRKIDAFTADFRTVTVDWPVETIDPFFNVNTPEELAHAESLHHVVSR